MTPNYDGFAARGPSISGVDQRRAARYRILQRCIVRPPQVAAADGWRGIVFSMSKTGIGVTLPAPLGRGTELEIDAWNQPGAPTIKAHIVHITRLESVWLAGCEFTYRLTDEEVAAWLATATAGP